MATSHSPLVDRRRTNMTEEDAIPTDDMSETTKLFSDRLQAWKHACGYLEDYVSASEKLQHAHAKEYEKLLKTVNHPLKEGEHFDQNLGGIAEMFDNIRTNTQGIANSHGEAAKQLKGQVLPIFERLYSEIKTKSKELTKGVGKGSKAVDKARNNTQKQIELLGQHTATYDSAAVGKVTPETDPYILQKGVYHRLNKQIQEENSTRNDMLTIQNNFSQFEAHVVQTMQQGMGHFMQAVAGQSDQQKVLYSNIVQVSQSINPSFEWNGFVKRNNNILIDPHAPQRSLDNVSFANQHHKSTQALIQGKLERKSGLLKKYDSAFYVVTASKFLHQFNSEDMLAKEPSPELSLYIPDCTIGGCNGNTFNIKGKDLSSRLSTSKEFEFKAPSDREAEQWWTVVRQGAGHVRGMSGAGELSSPGSNSPTSSRNVSGMQQQRTMDMQQQQFQEAGIIGGSEGGSGYVERPYPLDSPTSGGGMGNRMSSGQYVSEQALSANGPGSRMSSGQYANEGPMIGVGLGSRMSSGQQYANEVPSMVAGGSGGRGMDVDRQYVNEGTLSNPGSRHAYTNSGVEGKPGQY